MIQLMLDIEDPRRIQDFILAEVPQDGESRPRPRPAPPQYSVIISSGPDFVASRTYRGKTSTLVMLVTQGQYYIRTGDNIKQLTGRRLHQWVSGNDEVDENIRPAWSDESLMRYDRESCCNLMKIIEFDTARELIKRDLLHFQPFELSRIHYVARLTETCEWDAVEPVIRLLTRHYGHDIMRRAVSCACHTVFRDPTNAEWVPACATLEECDFAARMIEMVGPDNTLKIIRAMDDAFERSHAVWHTMYHTQRILEVLRIGEADASNSHIASYLASMIAHAPDGPERTLDAYATYLRVQLQVRDGHITDPMPRDLNAAMRTIVAEREAQINAQYSHIQERAASLAAEGYEDDNWIIRPIRDYVELQRESEHMHNCLESYASDFDDGHCELWVMRRKARPERSYIDIEIRMNRVRQAFRGCNEHLSDDEWAIVDRWALNRGVNLIHERNVPLAPPRR